MIENFGKTLEKDSIGKSENRFRNMESERPVVRDGPLFKDQFEFPDMGEKLPDSDRPQEKGPLWREKDIRDEASVKDDESSIQTGNLDKNFDGEAPTEDLSETDAANKAWNENTDKQLQEGKDNAEGKEGLSDEEKAKIKKETGWSDEVIDAIGSMEEYEVYKKAGLQEAEINGKKCLIRDDIDWEQKDPMGRTNKERAEQGLSPVNKDGKVIELHHIGQHADSPLAELTPEEHRGKGSDAILHNKNKDSEIDRQAFAGERNSHWEARAKEGGK